jgi:1-acyl-sn-glycerol-3-phosphate acyltransferase
MNALRSLVFVLVFYSVTLVALPFTLPAALLGRRSIRGFANLWVRFHRLCARYILGISTRIEGTVPVGAVLVAGKHQSMYETLEIAVVLRNPAVVLKRQLADLPFFGWAAQRYGMIPVDREGGAAALRAMMRAAGETIAEDRPIVIFPEGTRVSPGEQPPLQPGFAGLYRALKLPVVPLAVDSGRLWPRRRFVKRPGIVTMQFGEPVPPGLPRGEVEARVHAAINALDG